MKFTEKQQWALDRFNELAAAEGSANKAGEICGVRAPIVSAIKNGTYKGSYENQFNILITYFETKEAAAENYCEVDYAPTSISSRVYETIRACQIKGGFALATGDAGIGKTKAIMKFASDYPTSSIVITINPCCKSTKAVLKLLAIEMGIPIVQSVDDLWMNIASRLHDGMTIIVDEAQLLPHHSIETLRSFADYFDKKGRTLGVALVGDNGIREKIEGKTKQMYRQVNNRSWQRPFFQTKDITFEDIEMLFPLLRGHTIELQFLHKVAQTEEGIRGAVRLFSNAYDNGRYDYAGIVAMSKAMHMKLDGLRRVIA